MVHASNSDAVSLLSLEVERCSGSQFIAYDLERCIVRIALAGDQTEGVCVLPASGSVVLSAPTIVPFAASSAIVSLLNANSVGASFRSLTVIVSIYSTVRPPESVLRMRTL